MEQILIKGLAKDDALVLQKLAEATFRETYTDKNSPEDMQLYIETNFSEVQLTTELQNRNSYFFMAMAGSTPVGYIKLNTGTAQTEPKSEDYLELERIYVSQTYQGNKVGQLLLAHAENIARTQGRQFIWLGVWEENLKAIGFYEKNGFVPFDTHIFKLGKDEQTDILMRKKIK
ncbi:MAG: GNAT family N-acetyltransferase [Chitinophagaceae bacterium]|nr:MAG: GNAT family N-acetyltransferase [Chitinophagaceae bacterium]